MGKRLPLTDEGGEVRELTADDFKHFKPASEVLPPELLAVLPRRGRPTVASPKKAVNIRLAPDILSAFKSTGKGWQSRINDALRDWLKAHPQA
jgi:uncharacterized protein (DUF4415 family)